MTASGVTGNTGANGNGVVTVISPTTFSIAGTVGTGSGTGGTWHVTGLYTYTFAASSINGFDSATLYTAVLEGTALGISFSYTQTFQIT